MLSFMLDLVFAILLGNRRLPLKRLLPLSVGAGAATGLVFDILIPVVFSKLASIGVAVTAVMFSAIIHGAVVFGCAYLVGRRSRRGYGG